MITVVLAGASGFLLKDAPAEELTNAIHVLARGDALPAPAVTRRIVEAFVAIPEPPEMPDLEDLSPREVEVLRLLAAGAPTRRSPTSSSSARRRSRPTSATSSRSCACATASTR